MKNVANIFYNSLYQLFIVLIPIITIPYISRVLGANLIGEGAYLNSISNFLSTIILCGLMQLGAREIAKAKLKDRSITFYSLWKIQLISGIIIISCFSLATLFYVNKDEYILYFSQVPFLISFIFDISWFYVGIGEMTRVIKRNIIVKCFSLVIIILFVKESSDFILYLFINSISFFLSNIFFWIGLKKYLNMDFRESGLALVENIKSRQFIKASIVLLLPQIAVQFYTSFDSTLVANLSNNIELSYYSQSQKIARIILQVLTSVSIVVMPIMANLSEDSNDNKLLKMTKISADFTLALAFYFTSLILVNTKEFVPWFFGENFSNMSQYMFWVSFIIIPIAYGGVFSNQFALAKGMYKEYAIPYFLGAFISVLGNLLIIPKYGGFGAIIVLISVECLVCVARIFFVRKMLNIKSILKGQYKYFLIFLLLNISGWFTTIGNSYFFTILFRSLNVTLIFIVLNVLFKTSAYRILNNSIRGIILKKKS